MKLLVVLVLAVFTGCNANLVWQNPPKHQVDMVKDAFWDYVARATMTAEDSLKQIRRSELGRDVKEMKQKMEQSLEEFQTSMIPLTQNFQTQLKQKTQEIQQNLAPYGEELKDKLDTDVQNLKKQLAALWESFTQLTQ
ncbi:apolipoprotein A-I-like [Seriola lalandi dorsalis]|uniref:apolipoprotein A-I-like n=1 Tax=Seriola lalandi dorsalis TaxID=1841481 RepID=UPI000C6F58D8|nr:apolipoprotein A-I-like [Seriola lalandi dorsalis]